MTKTWHDEVIELFELCLAGPCNISSRGFVFGNCTKEFIEKEYTELNKYLIETTLSKKVKKK